MTRNNKVLQLSILLVCAIVVIVVIGPFKKDQPRQLGENAQGQAFASVPEESVENEEVQQSSGGAISLEQVKELLMKQGINDKLYWEALSYEEVELDRDDEPEVVAAIDGGSHLGAFFIFDKTSSGDYSLIFDKSWKVASLNFGAPIEVAEKKLLQVVEMTGGSGVSVQIAHLLEIQNGEVIEAWQGTLKDMNAMFGGNYYVVAGSFQIVNDIMYAWETRSELEDDTVTVKGKPTTTVKMYTYNGTQFIEQK